ncbi:MAG TPA: GNAT family N-acetyltransferase [Gemmatimonadaceae bacterium]
MTLHLRPVTADDLAVLFEHQSDAEAARMAAFTPRDLDAFLTHWRKILNDPTALTLIIAEGSEVLGYVASFNVEDERSIGYWVGRQHWRRGVGRAAVALFLGIETTRPLFAHVVRSNVASARILERCDFRVVGTSTTAAATGEEAVEELIFRLD